MILLGLIMNISDVRIVSIDEGDDYSCWFSDDEKNIYFDSSYTGGYSEGDRVSVGWAYFGSENRNVLWVEKI